jgi:hypothetical protein
MNLSRPCAVAGGRPRPPARVGLYEVHVMEPLILLIKELWATLEAGQSVRLDVTPSGEGVVEITSTNDDGDGDFLVDSEEFTSIDAIVGAAESLLSRRPEVARCAGCGAIFSSRDAAYSHECHSF